MKKTIQVGNLRIGEGIPLTIIGGPCAAESTDLCLQVGRALSQCCSAAGLGYVFKASYDKANRTSAGSPRGPGIDVGLDMLAEVREMLGVPVTTDVHDPAQAVRTAAVVDLLQIPAFLCRQSDLLQAAAETGCPVNVKKGQFMAPAEMAAVRDKMHQAGAGERLMLTERGTFFGYHRLVNDFIGLGDLLELGCPICFDATHSTQLPGAGGGEEPMVSGGRPERAPLLARAAVAAGVHAVFIETHPDPAVAMSDGATMLPLSDALPLIDELGRLAATVHTLQGH